MAVSQVASQTSSRVFCLNGDFAGVSSSAKGRIISSVSCRGGAPSSLSSPLTVSNSRRSKGGRKSDLRPRVQVPRRAGVTIEAVIGVEKKVDGGAGSKGDEAPPVKQPGVESAQVPSMDVDSVTEAELKENGFRSTRRTKLVCTIGPASCAPEQLEALAMGGMNVARLNMCHGTREWHTQVIRNVRSLNSEKGYSVAIMMDTEGSEIHMGDFNGAPSVKAEVSVGAASLCP